MVIKHGTVDYFFFLCRNAAILSFLVSNKRKLVVGSLSCSSLAPVSFQLTFDPFSLMQCFEPRGFQFFFCAMFYKALFREMMISLLIQSQDYRRIHLRDFRIPCNVTKTRFCQLVISHVNIFVSVSIVCCHVINFICKLCIPVKNTCPVRDGPLEKLWGVGEGNFEPQELFFVIIFLV